MLFDGQSLVESLVRDWRMFLSKVIHGGMFRHLINSKWGYSRYNRYNLANKPVGGIVWYFELLQVPSVFFAWYLGLLHILSRTSFHVSQPEWWKTQRTLQSYAPTCPNMSHGTIVIIGIIFHMKHFVFAFSNDDMLGSSCHFALHFRFGTPFLRRLQMMQNRSMAPTSGDGSRSSHSPLGPSYWKETIIVQNGLPSGYVKIAMENHFF